MSLSKERSTSVKSKHLPKLKLRGTRLYLPWTAEEEQTLRNLRSHGASTLQIAYYLSRSYDSVVSKCRAMGFPRRTIKWTAAKERELKEYVASGYKRSVIAKLFGCTRNALDVKVCQLRKSGRW